MDKTGFLKELKQYLAVLNDGEQKDILDEYSQHIDMKMERGMSEPEAIKDFGDIKELASEILEAYHVNPQYGAKKHTKFAKKEEMPAADLRNKGRKLWASTTGFFKKAVEKASGGLAWLWQMAKKPFHLLAETWKNRKNRQNRQNHLELPASLRKRRQAEDCAMIRRKNMIGEIPGMAANGIRNLWMATFHLAAWCVRWAWNLFMLFVALITGMMLLGSLYGLGVLVVLLLQGYPLAGFMLGCLGLVLCTGALTVIAICLCRFSKKAAVSEAKETYVEESTIEEAPEHV